MRLTTARITLVAVLFVTPSTSGADVQSFTLGHVDLLGLADSVPLGTIPPAGVRASGPPRTLRDLHVRIESFLNGDVKVARQNARGRLDAARRNAALDSGTSSYDGNPLGAVLAVAIGSLAYGMNANLRQAKACVEFLERLEYRTRALLDAVPETDEPASSELLARWERVSAELQSNGFCPGNRGP
jgi:hypothetical protein